MIRFLKEHIFGRGKNAAHAPLGRLEFELMKILWSRGQCNVREAVNRLERPLAYTTVMTTLDRLYKKGLLDRRLQDRAYLYSARWTREQWERQRAEHLLAGFFAGPNPSTDLLLSSFLEAVGEHGAALLDELEKKVRQKRRELLRRSQP
jgi:predicted transcriptional regulator